MKPCKRIEIVIEQAMSNRVAEALSAHGHSAYTMIPDVAGHGERGTRRNDDPSGTLRNCVMVIACAEDEAQALVEAIRPLLTKAGGMCLVSDAHWVQH